MTPRRLVVPLLVALALLTSGCFGKFQIVRNLYGFNRTVSEDRFTRWVVFVAMNIAPVYPVGAMADAFVANPIEFWSGENPVKDSARWLPRAGPQVRLTPLPDGRMHLESPNGVRLTLRLEPDALLVFDEHGALRARVADRDGRAALVEGTLSAR